MLTCRLCGNAFKLLAKHLTVTHKISVDEYVKKFDCADELAADKAAQLQFRRSNSPSSLDFYLSRGASLEEARASLKAHSDMMKTSCANGDDQYPYQLKYWTSRGLTDTEAVEKVAAFSKSVSNTRKNMVEKYGKEHGNAKYDAFMKSLRKRKDVELRRLMFELNCTLEEAYQVYSCRKAINFSNSRLKIQYWLDLGYSEDAANHEIKQFYKTFCVFTPDYWMLKHGMSETESIAKVKQVCDSRSVKGIMRRYGVDEFTAYEIHSEIGARAGNTQARKNSRNAKEESAKILYYESVAVETLKSYREMKHLINPNNYPRCRTGNGYQLDHKFSISEGFNQGLSPKIIGHWKNLEIIPRIENISKNAKCSITLKDLLKAINED